jgi:hypothetical protein
VEVAVVAVVAVVVREVAGPAPGPAASGGAAVGGVGMRAAVLREVGSVEPVRKASKWSCVVLAMSLQTALRGLRSLAGRQRTTSESRYSSHSAAIGPYISWPSFIREVERWIECASAAEKEEGGGLVSVVIGGGGGCRTVPGAADVRLVSAEAADVAREECACSSIGRAVRGRRGRLLLDIVFWSLRCFFTIRVTVGATGSAS